jgi:hypothetical protein
MINGNRMMDAVIEQGSYAHPQAPAPAAATAAS